jgi:hypothetical protein
MPQPTDLRDIDAKIAMSLFGWKDCKLRPNYQGNDCIMTGDNGKRFNTEFGKRAHVPLYSKDPLFVQAIAEAMSALKWRLSSDFENGYWGVYFWDNDPRNPADSKRRQTGCHLALALPEAVCRAALSALSMEGNDGDTKTGQS